MMRKGISITELARQVQEQSQQKLDIVTDTRKMRLIDGTDKTNPLLVIDGMEERAFQINEYAHGQLAAKTLIPKKFYDRIRSKYPDVYKMCVNSILMTENERRMIRIMGGTMRAMLSDRYRRLDNDALLAHGILPILANNELNVPYEVASANVTEQSLYLAIGVPSLRAEVRPGDEIHAGFVIKNSEVGASSLGVYPFFTRLVCTNGMIMTSMGKRKFHVGRTLDDESMEIFSQETIKADDKAFFMKVRDMVRACIEPDGFNNMVSAMRSAAEQKVEVDDAPKILEQKFNVIKFEAEKIQTIMEMNMERDGSNVWSLANAVTQYAGQIEDYDRSMELLSVGGRIVAEAA